MHTFVLQDWITVRGQNSSATYATTIVQSENDWLDLSPFQDLFVWVMVAEISYGSGGSVALYLDTSPTEDESLFQSMTSGAAFSPIVVSATPQVIKLPMLSANVPLARFLRWRLVAAGTASNAWDLTFRIVVAANSPGM